MARKTSRESCIPFFLSSASSHGLSKCTCFRFWSNMTPLYISSVPMPWYSEETLHVARVTGWN